MTKKFIAAVAAALLLCSLCSCGKKESSGLVLPKPHNDFVFSVI